MDESGWMHIEREFVKVRGTLGTATFSGFLWGYNGEGTRGLHQLLMTIGVDFNLANYIAFDTRRNSDIGVDWHYDIATKTLTESKRFGNKAA